MHEFQPLRSEAQRTADKEFAKKFSEFCRTRKPGESALDLFNQQSRDALEAFEASSKKQRGNSPESPKHTAIALRMILTQNFYLNELDRLKDEFFTRQTPQKIRRVK